MPIKRMCCHAGCPRYREEGSKFCSVHREADEAKDRKRYADYLSNRYNRQHTTSVYADLYRSSEWKELRKKVIEQHPYCAECGSKFGLKCIIITHLELITVHLICSSILMLWKFSVLPVIARKQIGERNE